MSNSRLITVTLNPSLDRTMTVHYLAVGYYNRTTETTRLDPAGKGMNISRALRRLGHDTEALLLLGSDSTGQAYQALVADEAFPITIIRHAGTTRSNVILRDTGNKAETNLIEDSTGATDKELEAIAGALRGMIAPGDFVVFAGSLPSDAPIGTYARLTRVAHDAGARVALVTFGEPLNLALEATPDLIALDQQELESLFHHPVRVQEDVLYCTQKLREMGVRQVLVLAEGETNAAILAAEEGNWQVTFPNVETSGTRIGLLDALVAGFLAGRVSQRPLEEALELGAAAATYATTQVGSVFGSPDEVKVFLDETEVTSLDAA